MRISDWSSDVCSSDLCCLTDDDDIGCWSEPTDGLRSEHEHARVAGQFSDQLACHATGKVGHLLRVTGQAERQHRDRGLRQDRFEARRGHRSEEHTSELQSLMRISYAVFCLKKQKNTDITTSYKS